VSSIIQNESAPNLEEIWRLFRENERRFQETDRRFQETDRRFQETDRQFKETERFLREQTLETNRQIKEVNKKIGELGNRLGEFVEGLIKPSVVKLFQERGIAVHVVTRDVEANNPELGLEMQIDLFVSNRDSCVLIEVKSNLGQDDVNEHIKRMEKFKPLFPAYADKRVYGAVAGMVIADNVAKYAYRQGFFVIAQKGEAAVILNDSAFKPTAW
jgi:hypothetical protein